VGGRACKRTASAKRAAQPSVPWNPRLSLPSRKFAARPKAKKAKVAAKRAKPITRVKRAKRKVAKRKVVAAKSRRAAVKAVRRNSKARGKK